MEIGEHRRQYEGEGLLERDVDPDPVRQFERWFREALTADITDPTAMALATATKEGVPSVRTVLLKSFDARGFIFYTDYGSRKGRELAENPRAALLFYWPPLNRQVKIRGTVERLPRQESETYFRTRPLRSQLAAWASRQSEVICGREEMDRRVAEMERRFGDGSIPLPPYWGGLRLAADEFEFWLGRPDRLHDRIRYVRDKGGGWAVERLSP